MRGYECPPRCSRCCEDRGSPVELTVGDTIRVGAFLRIPLITLMDRFAAVMWNRIPGTRAFVPSLGLAFPCRFRVDGRCAIYQVRPLGCRLFPEGPALRAEADREIYRDSGYPCFDRGVSLPPSRAERTARLLARHAAEARQTEELFRNAEHACVLTASDFDGIARELAGVSPLDRNARRREACLARIPATAQGRARCEFAETLRALDRARAPWPAAGAAVAEAQR